MNILCLLVQKPVIGGHFKSAQAWMGAMAERGHNVHIIVRDSDRELLQPFRDLDAVFNTLEGLKCFFESRILLWSELQCGWALRRYIKKHRIDFVFIQDLAALIPGVLAAGLSNLPCCYVQAGGRARNDHPPGKAGLIVFSEEQQSAYQAWGRQTVLISARIDQTIYFPHQTPCAVLDKYKISEGGVNGFIAIRLEADKKGILESLFKLAEESLLPEKSQILIAGSGPLYPELRARAEVLNARPNSHVKLYFIGPVYDGRLLRDIYCNVDFVCGNGRGLMEAMSCGCATVIFGNNGEHELVEEKTVSDISFYNFSGRHFAHRAATKPADGLTRLFNPEELSHIKEFSLRYARTQLSARIGAEQTEKYIATLKPLSKTDLVGWLFMRILARLKRRLKKG